MACDGRRAAFNPRRHRPGWHRLLIQVRMGAAHGSSASATAFGTTARLGNHHPDSSDRRNSRLWDYAIRSTTCLGWLSWRYVVAFLSASQDIVIDAWRVESLSTDQQAPGAAMIQSGYRIGMLAAGAGGLFIAAYAGWFAAYATMAALLGVGLLVFLFGPEPKVPAETSSCCGIGMASDSPRVFDRRDRSVSRFHESAALARHPDRHLRIQAGRGDGGSDVDAALHIAWVLAARDRRLPRKCSDSSRL